MTVRRLDANGDIATSGIQFISEAEEIAQTVKTRLDREDADRETAYAAGAPGVAALLAGGFLDPFNLLPGGTIYRGFKLGKNVLDLTNVRLMLAPLERIIRNFSR